MSRITGSRSFTPGEHYLEWVSEETLIDVSALIISCSAFKLSKLSSQLEKLAGNRFTHIGSLDAAWRHSKKLDRFLLTSIFTDIRSVILVRGGMPI